jgi:hypothetical protein
LTEIIHRTAIRSFIACHDGLASIWQRDSKEEIIIIVIVPTRLRKSVILCSYLFGENGTGRWSVARVERLLEQHAASEEKCWEQERENKEHPSAEDASVSHTYSLSLKNVFRERYEEKIQ